MARRTRTKTCECIRYVEKSPEKNKITLFFLLAQDAIRNDTIAQILERRQEFDEREHNRAVNEFRALHQQPFAQSSKIVLILY